MFSAVATLHSLQHEVNQLRFAGTVVVITFGLAIAIALWCVMGRRR